MFIQHQNSFIQTDKITYFSVDYYALRIIINFSSDNFYQAEFENKSQLDNFVAQLRSSST